MMRRGRGRGRRGDAAVSEVLGYILMFFLSSAILMLSLQAFLMSRESTDNLRAASELRLVSDRVAAEVLQAGMVAAEMPDATYEAMVRLPDLGGRAYYIEAGGGKLWANTTDGALRSEAQAFQVQAQDVTLKGTVYGAQGYAKVRYEKVAGVKTIELTI